MAFIHLVNITEGIMHTIAIKKEIKGFEKAYVAAIAMAMNINLPNKIKLNTPSSESTYIISCFSLQGVKKINPGG